MTPSELQEQLAKLQKQLAEEMELLVDTVAKLWWRQGPPPFPPDIDRILARHGRIRP